MAEKEQAHRHSTDHKRLDTTGRLKPLGKYLGLLQLLWFSVICVARILRSSCLCSNGSEGVTASLAAVFVFGQKYKTKRCRFNLKMNQMSK